MKSHFRYLLFFVLAGLFFPACDRMHQPSQEILDRAESYMTNHPDSALFMLENTLSTAVLSPRQQADRAILLTQARDKNYITHTSDSLIRIAVDYYENKRNPERLMTAYYYTGRVSQDMGDAQRALGYYHKALHIGESSNNYRLLGLINNTVGSIHLEQEVYEEAAKSYKQAIHYFCLLNDSTSQAFPLRNLARVFSVQEELDSAIVYYEQALTYTSSRGRSAILNELGVLHKKQESFDSAHNYMQTALEENISPYNHHIFLNLGELYMKTGKLDSAFFYLKQSAESDRLRTKAGAYKQLYYLAKTREQHKEALDLHEMYETLRDSILDITDTESIRKMQNMYNYYQVEQDLNRAKLQNLTHERNQYLWLAFVLLLLILLILFYIYYKARNRKWEQQQERLNSLLQEQKEMSEGQFAENEEKIKELEIQLRESRESESVQFKMEELLLRNREIAYRKHQQKQREVELQQTPIYQKYHQKGFDKSTPADFEELKVAIDNAYPEFAPMLHQFYPKIKKSEIELCYLYKAGITSIKVIAKHLNLSSQGTIMKRDRLYEKIFNQKGNSKSFDLFIASL